MKLVALVCLCLVTRCGITAAGVNGPEVVEEGSDVILPCSLSTKENIQSELFDWKKDGPRNDREVFLYDAGIHYNNGYPGQSETFKGRVSHFPDQLEYGIASIIIRNTKMTDSGNYTCDFPRLQPSQIFHLELIVGAAPEPYVTILDETKDWSRLQCWVQGASPVPKVEWQDSDGNILPAEKPQVSERGGSYDVILNATVTKTDYYRCVATQETISHQTYAEIYVYIGGPEVVEEGSDVILPCSLSTKENIQSTKFDWKKDGPRDDREVFLYDAGIHYNNGYPGQSERFKGRVSHFPDQLEYGIASITIRNTKVTDSGNYTCDFPRLQPSQIFRVELIVDRVLKDRTGENIPGAAPKPSVTSLKTTKYSWRLQCEVHGNPVPKVEWQDSDGNILPAEKPQVSKSGDRYDVILNANVNKTDYYRCVATQETISHQTYVYISGPKVVEEGSDVILPCSLSTKENIQSETFDWKKDGPSDEREVFLYNAGIHYNNRRSGQSETFKGRVSHFEDQLKNGIASIIIRNTKVTDSGNYTCYFPRLQPSQIFYVELVVGAGAVAAPKPTVTSLDQTKYWSRLQCEVHGNPEPHLQWQDSDGNNLTAEKPQVSKSGDCYNVILQVTVTKTDRYRCVATQETISHQTYKEIHVYIVGPEVVKLFAALGSDVILPCSLSTKENIQSKLFDWKKAGQRDHEVFLYDAGIHYNNGRSGQSETFKGRVSHFPDQLKNGNASIIIRNTKMTDSGNYACDFLHLQPRQMFYVELIVGGVLKDRSGENIEGAAPEPLVTILDRTEDGMLLQCRVRGAFPKPHVQWQDSAGNNLTAEEPQVSKSGDVILQVTVNKTDHYRCVATQETICHQIHSETYVSLNVAGAAPKPSVTSLDQTKDWSRLQCEVHGNPEPHLQWQDSDGNNLTAEESQVSKSGDRYNVILRVTVTKTDRYRCVATQETISHQTYKEIHVYIVESSTGWVGWTVLGIVLFVGGVLAVLVAVLRSKGCITLNWNKDEENTRNSPDANSGASLPLKSTDNN